MITCQVCIVAHSGGDDRSCGEEAALIVNGSPMCTEHETEFATEGLIENRERLPDRDCCELTDADTAKLRLVAHLSVEELERVLKRAEWVSAEERLPETEQPVLIVALGDVGMAAYRLWSMSGKRCWMHRTGVGYVPMDRVSHWMPLPDPPGAKS